MGEQEKVEGSSAPFLPRASALILDGIILAVLCVILGLVLGLATRSHPHLAVWVGLFVSLGVPAIYFTLSTSLWGYTVGKKVFNLRVVGADGQTLTLGPSFLRWLVSFLFAIPFGIGYWVGVFRPDGRDLPDLASGSRVLQTGPYNRAGLILFIAIIPFMSIPGLGIFAAIAIPRFAQMLEKSREAATKGNLIALKSALAIYHQDHPGKWPANLEKDLVPKYIADIPTVKATGAFVAKAQSPAGNKVAYAVARRQVPRKSESGWLYDRFTGNIYVNSTVKDSKGVPYSFYGFE